MDKINFNLIFKRVAAYLVDIIVIFVVASIIVSVPLFKKFNNDYNEIYSEFGVVLDNYNDIIKDFNEKFEDKEINQEEYDSLMLYDEYKDYFAKVYDDGNISEDEYKLIVGNINDKYLELSEEFNYKLKKASVINSVITLICMFLYFGVVQYILNGRTVGKLILKLRVTSVKEDKVSLWALLLRCLIVNNIFLNGINLLLLFLLSKSTYLNIASLLDFSITLVESVIIFLIITRKDSRGLHDLICGTIVIVNDNDRDDSKKKIKSKNVIDGEFSEKWYLCDIFFWINFFIKHIVYWKEGCMEKIEIIKNIASRTGGDIYLGVVGAVRTGKSTFIRRFMENMVIPNIVDEFEKKRALDELPQAASGKTIMTTEPKFVPASAAKIMVDDFSANIKMIDCVGYVIKNAKGIEDENGIRYVMTPWYEC